MNTKFLNGVKIDLSSTIGVKNPAPTNNSILTKEQIDALISANSPTTVSYLIKDGIYDNAGTADSAAVDSTYQIGDGVMAFDNITVNGVSLTAYNIYRCVTAGDLSTVVFSLIDVNDETTITSVDTIVNPLNSDVIIFGGYVYKYDPAGAGLDFASSWKEGDLLLKNTNITAEIEVPIFTSGTYLIPTFFPAGSKVSKIEIIFKETANGTTGTGSVSVGTPFSPDIIMDNSDLQSSAGFNLQQFTAGGYWEKIISGVTFAENNKVMISITSPTGATTGKFIFRVTTF